MQYHDNDPLPSLSLECLTPRELEVVQLLGVGKCNKEIAMHLGIAEQTVKVYCSAIYQKLKLGNRVYAAIFMQSQWLLPAAPAPQPAPRAPRSILGKVRRATCAMILLCLSVTSAYAASITIESGVVGQRNSFDQAGFVLSGHDFEVRGGGFGFSPIFAHEVSVRSLGIDSNPRQCNPCINPLSLTYQGQTVSAYKGQLDFTSGIPMPTSLVAPGVSQQTTFTMAGLITLLDPVTNTRLFDLTLTGAGLHTVTGANGVVYNFAAGGGDPIPEPSTWLLLATGLLALGWYQRRFAWTRTSNLNSQ